ncbi:EAL domain-containing protein [Thalassospira tepidiphila]|uniref:EAL domain-containing protein n=1 Tax=Thalassospira tepidiphila TaxID=393657 RepID=UPI001BCE92F9|nr:EAL domain-containing protein [Thalassospira tepidiphila]
MSDIQGLQTTSLHFESPREHHPKNCWRVLVVDDDADVHEATDYALAKVKILGRPLELIHAHSASEAMQILNHLPNIAVILLDVVMERPDSGLKLVKEIRSKGYREPRVILRTGYPGRAPEKQVIRDYEIDDYCSKDELTRTRLVTSITTAIRAVDYIRTLSGTRAGLEMVIEGTQYLYGNKNLDLFAEGVLMQISAILRLSPEGGICALGDGNTDDVDLAVLSGVGRFAGFVGESLGALENIDHDVIGSALENGGEPLTVENKIVFSFRSDTGRRLLMYFEHVGQLHESDLVLLQVFTNNLAICFDNLALITELGELAFVDQRVGIPNQNAFDRELQLIAGGKTSEALVAMVAIEDAAQLCVAFGLSYFEAMMSSVYDRLRYITGDNVLVARVGEYTLGIVDSAATLEISAIEDAFDQPFVVAGSPVVVRATIGVVRGNPKGHTTSNIQRAARLTLLRQKQAGPGGTAEFKPEMADEVQNAVRLVARLRQALQNRQLTYVFQPKVRLVTGEVTGCEVLCRWNDGGQPVSPGLFIPIAERAGLSAEITFQCLDAIVDFNARLTADDIPPVQAAVNLAAHDIGNQDFIDQLITACELRDLGPADVCFEITETQHFTTDGEATTGIQNLAEQGFDIWLDDFGTGFSSLTHLDILPVCGIKIDKSFISVLHAGNVRGSVAASAAAIIENLGLRAIAEGVETPEQHQICKSLGVEFAQGFLYSPGISSDAYVTWFKNWDLDGQIVDGEH